MLVLRSYHQTVVCLMFHRGTKLHIRSDAIITVILNTFLSFERQLTFDAKITVLIFCLAVKTETVKKLYSFQTGDKHPAK
jgi:hypothetical protein